MTPLLRVLLTTASLAAPTSLLAQSISGTVFEDINYGGGAGRSLSTANAVRAGSAAPVSAAATVELYDASGAFIRNTTTSTAAATLGQYTFGSLTGNRSYTVRVVNNTVRSNRGTATPGLLPVQTYVVRNGVGDANRVGGEVPDQVDAPSNAIPETTLKFQGLSSGTDNSAFVDLVDVLNSANTVVASAVPNSSFEIPKLSPKTFQYNPTGATWIFGSGSGISADGSGFGSTASNGNQVAFLQNTGSFQQNIVLPAGTYKIRFQATQRAAQDQSVQVLINGVEVFRVTPPKNSYATYTSNSFTVAATPTLSDLVAQSQAPISLPNTTTAVTGVDFGFNFSTIVNTNDAGQGSLAQFIANANALDNSSSLNQQGLVAGRNTSVFMISDGLAHPGLRAGLANQLSGSVGARRALVNLTANLPIVTSAGTNLDGTTQTANIGNTNALQLGTGGTVGVDKLVLSKVEGPEVELSVSGTTGNVVELNAANCTLRGMAIHGSANAVRSAGSDVLIEGNMIGTTAVAVATPATAPVGVVGVQLVSPIGLMQNNIVGYNGSSGVNYSAGAGTTGFTFRNNEFVQNGRVTAGGDALSIGDAGVAGPVLIEGNLISFSNSSGIQFEVGRVSNNIVRNNTLKGNGTGGASTRLEGSGIHYLARNATVNSTNTDLITRNIITENQSSGVVINYGQRNVRISQNSIFLNGNNTIPGAAGLLSIDFTGPKGYVGGDVNYGQGDGVTPNDSLLDNGSYATVPPVRQGNGGIDYPIITNITQPAAGKLRVQGYVGSAAGQSRFGGATVEIFSANNADTNQNGPTTTDPGSPIVAHGEAQSYVGTTTADANGNFDVTFNSVVTTINSGDIVTATAYLPSYGTSECGVNLISSFQVLPVQLAKFTAQAEGNQVRVSWETATELHNDRFEVERSVDARNFAVVGTVAGRGTTSQGQRYTLLDTPPAAALLYYRLRQVDTDGTDTYSAVQTVRFGGAAGPLALRPNPATNSTELNLSQLPTGAYTLTLYDLRGRLVQTNTASGGQPYTLDLRAVPAGVYVLTVQGASQTYTQRLVKTE